MKGSAVALQGAIQEVLDILEEMKPSERADPKSRYVAIAITETEKLQALTKTFLG